MIQMGCRKAIFFGTFLLMVGCSSDPPRSSSYPTREIPIFRQEPPILPPRKPATTGDTRAYFGIHANTCLDSKGKKGAYIVEFYNSSAAKENGLAIGDRIIKFGRSIITTSGDLTDAIKLFPPKDAAAISIVRNGRPIPDILIISKSYDYTNRIEKHIDLDVPDTNSLCNTINLRSP